MTLLDKLLRVPTKWDCHEIHWDEWGAAPSGLIQRSPNFPQKRKEFNAPPRAGFFMPTPRPN